ncbi:MAG: hypothetical protein GX074_00030 [Erysipelothrix sp.]|nr:hypothetical protein [Erysipelothrix sp.]
MMHLYGENEFRIEANFAINNQEIETLFLMYQPILGANSISIYLSLLHATINTDYTNLARNTGLNIDEIERSLIMLERYRLIETYKHHEQSEYAHILKRPLAANDFLNHYVYGLELKKVIGTHQFNVLLIKFKEKKIAMDGFVNITEKKVFNQNAFSEKDLEILLKNDPIAKPLDSQFNFDLFLNDASELKFPSILRTKENLNLISELALFYGISETRMATLVYRSINYAEKELVVDRLLDRVRRETVEVVHNVNKYDLPNVAFLKSLQNGAAVSDYNKKLLEQLSFDMKLNKQVVNRLIEYVMESKNNQLIHNFVLQIATTWKAFDVNTVEEANKIIRKVDYSQKKNLLSEKSPTIERQAKTSIEVDEAEAEAIKAEWRKLNEQFGTNDN